MHHYLLLQTEPDKHNQLNNVLIGPPRIDRPSLVDEQAGFVPPSWWKGDEYASRSGIMAAATMRR